MGETPLYSENMGALSVGFVSSTGSDDQEAGEHPFTVYFGKDNFAKFRQEQNFCKTLEQMAGSTAKLVQEKRSS